MATNRILIICCIVGILLGYAVGYLVDSINLNTALTVGLIGGLAVGYLLDKRGGYGFDADASVRRESFGGRPSQSRG